ncbi:protein CNGC15b [Prunus persica]|uniref:protein CNGC15b n=1 Tax=Prunus persica TaxID=3760 RepID=UPI0009AB5DB9|nr:protein CNGC15b [Prunus persica]
METHHDSLPRESFLQNWKKIFVASCLFAVLLDPLFLYVPMMKDDIKCLQFDRNLKIAALLLRSLTDLSYLFDIIFQIYTSRNYSDFMHEYRRRHYYRSKIRYWTKFFVPTITKTMLGSYNILIDILAILPLPQVAILTFFSKLRNLRSLNTIRMVTMNLFVLLQYVPRVFRIYLLCEEFKQRKTGEIAIWVKGVLNFFMYILASHVLGAIWYFFAIQRMAICWHDACRKENKCNTSSFGCRDHHAFRNITFLNDICPISPVNVGIYITVLQSGIPGSTNFFQKFSNCFWWGLRNLSSLGSNLEPSVDGWENLFAAFISITGLLLFLYLIGNVQTYMQLDTQRIEAHRHKMKMEQKMEEKGRETELWLSKNGIPKKFKSQIMGKVRQELEENRDADLDYIFTILPLDLQTRIKMEQKMEESEIELWLSKNGIPKSFKSQIMGKARQERDENRDADLDYILTILPLDLQTRIKNCMPMARLKQVPMLQNMNEHVLRSICSYLKHREFDDNSIIIKKGEPLEMMLFIVDGHVSIEKRDGSSSNNNLQQRTRGAGEVCGEELLLSPSWILYPWFERPLATESAKAIGHVEALVLTASDLGGVVRMHHFVGMIRRIFRAKELEKATENYHENTIIHEDRYATFYKGVLLMPPDDETVVAIKKYTVIYHGDVAIEAAVASQTKHINVVRFLGGCLEPETRALVFEYIPNGTLFEHIHKEEAAGSFVGSSSPPTTLLSLELRLKIASETAGALAYLHSFSPPYIHLFLSSKHILLDHHYTAKLSAIGLSLYEFWNFDCSLNSREYFDPYFQGDRLAEKSDVYSFGVILAELLTSQKPASPNSKGEEPPLATSLLSSMEEGRLNQILDGEIIVDETTSETAKKVADLAKKCLRSKREERPSMEQVAVELEGLRKFMAKYQRGEPSFSNRPTSLQP